MMPGQGMGAAGTGAGQTPMMPSGMNPQLLAMLAQMQTGGQMQGGQMVQPPPGPTGAPPTGTPMSNFIGAGGNMAGMMQHPMGMPGNPAAAPGAGAVPGIGATPGQAAGGINPNIMALIAAMRGGQTGLGAGMGAAGVPGGMPSMQQMGQMGATLNNPTY